MQAIHYAAAGGHKELIISLIDQFGINPFEEANVKLSMTIYNT